MLSENIKRCRKNRGFTQETLAQQLGVVRQTVSKWEKGLSVPDAELLQRLAEVLETTVGELLGAQAVTERDSGEVAQQLARINEQLAIKNRRARRIWRTVGVIAGLIVVGNLLLMLFAYTYIANASDGPVEYEVIAESQFIEE